MSLTKASTGTQALRVDTSISRQLVRRVRQLLGWVPIRSLHPRHRKKIETHLLALSQTDRYLRFGHATGDEQIRRYVDGLNFERDEIFGVFNRGLQLIAMAHLACDGLQVPAGSSGMAEFGVSVAPNARGRGYGSHLFRHAVMHARNRRIATFFVHALSENAAMLKIARRGGATVERDGSESLAWLKLPPETLGSRIGQRFDTQAAEANFWVKRHAMGWGEILDAVQEVRAQVAATGKASQV